MGFEVDDNEQQTRMSVRSFGSGGSRATTAAVHVEKKSQSLTPDNPQSSLIVIFYFWIVPILFIPPSPPRFMARCCCRLLFELPV